MQFIFGFISGLCLSLAILWLVTLIFKWNPSGLEVESPKLSKPKGQTQFLEPVTPVERFEKAKNIGDLV